MTELLPRLLQSIEAHEPVALITVIQATGEYAASLGRRVLIWLDKPAYGELGLGELEAQLIAEARQVLAQRQPQRLDYYNEATGQITLFVEVQRQPPTLLIVGAGHVALPLAQLGKLIDFEVVILDDRPTYANPQRFPMADRVLAQPFTDALRQWPIDHDTYIVLVTRGHSHDVESLLEVIDSPARYIGMIGSKRRVRAVFELLTQERGIEPTKFNRVYAPIGLDIGAESPGEISVAIMAEIINIYRGGRAVSLSEALRTDHRLPLHPARSS